MDKFKGKYFFILIALLCSVILLGACGDNDSTKASKRSKENVLNIFNWSGYFPDSVIKGFEEETGIKVNYNTFSSNEEMYTKLSTGKAQYDLTVVTTNFVELLLKEDKLEKIDKSKIPNLKNIGPEFFGTVVDPDDEYTVPYLWGFYNIAVNEDLVDFEVKGYKDLLNPEFENSLGVVDDSRPVIGGMLVTLGYSPNSDKENEIREAGELFKKMIPNIKAFDTEIKNLLVSNDVKAAIVYSGDAALARRENSNIKIVFPEEGQLVWQDSMVIPKGAPHKENAEKFIDYINRPEVNKEIILEYPYGTANLEAVKLLPEDVRKEIEYEEQFKKGELLKEVGEATLIYDQLWTELKQSSE